MIQNDAGPRQVVAITTLRFQHVGGRWRFPRGRDVRRNRRVRSPRGEKVVNHFDYHATLLHLFGIHPDDLVYLRNGREQSLLDGQPGKIVKGLLPG
ncbi:MAG: hypothetical protein CM1200mP2_18790 [Planctomycetaceae bacterium]|nr:MAG: hypothetical protein CM1200mP2_18790 [Planctomycetaceae bacterium]